MHRTVVATFVLGACTPLPKTSAPASAAAACPAADKVVVLRWMETDDDGTKIAAGWRAFLTNTPREHDDGPTSYEAGPLAADAPRTIWIASGDGALCRATATGSFHHVTNVGPISEQTGVELSGCPKPREDQADEVFGLIADDAGACELALATELASRGGDVGDSGAWTAADASTPIPGALDAFVDHRACAAPCVALWNVRGAGDQAYDLTQTWTKSASGEACSIEHDDVSRIVVRASPRLVALPDGDVGNQALVGVFRDGGGPRLVVVEDVGEYSVFTVGATPALAVHRVWFGKNDEDANWRSMAPYCGP